MRVADASSTYRSLASLQSAASRLSSLQAQLSSGRQITTPSDDPAGTTRALQLRAEVKRNSQYVANAQDAQGWLSAADSAYLGAVKLLQNARTLVVQGLNTGASGSGAASSIADQLDAIRASLVNVANTAYNGRPVFGGTTAATTAYDSAGNYQGDAGAVTRTVGAQASVQINQTGPQVFGAPGSDVFTLLSNLATTLRTNPSAATAQLGALDGALARISSAQAVEGATSQQVQAVQDAQTTTGTTLAGQLSDLQDIDLADMAVRVSTANVTYQAALQTTASIRQVSLLDFLR